MPIVSARNNTPGEKGTHPPVRGYQKISHAARVLNFDFRGKTVLDIGSSTGGFTKYALDHGAVKVIAVEKGTNQMMSPLRDDPRVELHEKTDIFDVKINNNVASSQAGNNTANHLNSRAKTIICVPDTIVADVSFVSLTRVLSHAKSSLADQHTNFLVMLKPQFEADLNQLSNGIVKNERIRRDIIKKFEFWLKQHGFVIVDKCDNDLSGKHGNIERFYYLTII